MVLRKCFVMNIIGIRIHKRQYLINETKKTGNMIHATERSNIPASLNDKEGFMCYAYVKYKTIGTEKILIKNLANMFWYFSMINLLS